MNQALVLGKFEDYTLRVRERQGNVKVTAQRPLIEDSPEMINVKMDHYGVTQGDRANPWLKTYALSTCVGVVLYEPTKKLAGLDHVAEPIKSSVKEKRESVIESLIEMLATMERHGLTIEDRKTLRPTIIGGWGKDIVAYDLYTAVEEGLVGFGIPKQNIIFGERVGKEQLGKSIAVDLRTGQIYNLSNLKPPEPDEHDELYGRLWQIMGPGGVTDDVRSLR